MLGRDIYDVCGGAVASLMEKCEPSLHNKFIPKPGWYLSVG